MSSGSTQLIKQISTHNAIYRGFDIKTLPRRAHRGKTQYLVTLSDGTDDCHSFGKFDALAEATEFIDRLHGNKQNEKTIKQRRYKRD